jgi:hypothetical protein
MTNRHRASLALIPENVTTSGSYPLKKSHEHTGTGTEQRYAMIEELSVQFGVEQCLMGGSSYTIKPLGHARPAQSPARVLLSRVPLGPSPVAPPVPRL